HDHAEPGRHAPADGKRRHTGERRQRQQRCPVSRGAPARASSLGGHVVGARSLSGHRLAVRAAEERPQFARLGVPRRVRRQRRIARGEAVRQRHPAVGGPLKANLCDFMHEKHSVLTALRIFDRNWLALESTKTSYANRLASWARRTAQGPRYTPPMPASGASKPAEPVRLPLPALALAPADGPQTANATYFVSRYSPMPSKPPSRPKPDCLTPPKGAAGLDTMPWFTPTIPASMPSTTRNARARSRV